METNKDEAARSEGAHENEHKRKDNTKMTSAEEGTPDPTSKRNIGLNGETQRNDQKDELGNLIIRGNEVTGYGDNTSEPGEELKSGPGFGAEGSEYKGNPIRSEESENDENLPG